MFLLELYCATKAFGFRLSAQSEGKIHPVLGASGRHNHLLSGPQGYFHINIFNVSAQTDHTDSIILETID